MNLVPIIPFKQDRDFKDDKETKLYIEAIELDRNYNFDNERNNEEFSEKLDKSYNKALDSIKSICNKIQESFDDINNPSKISIELDIGFAVKAGQILAVVLNGETSSSLKITLEWENKK